MSSDALLHDANIAAPKRNKIRCYTITNVSTVIADLSAEPKLADAFAQGGYLSFYNHGPTRIFFFLSDTNVGPPVVVPTSVAGATQCWCIPVNAERPFRVTGDRVWLVARTIGANAILRVYPSSFDTAARANG